MTKLLDLAIAEVRKLPPADQDEAAEMLPLDDEAAAAIDEGLAQARRGEFASDAEIAALWRRHGL
jgi:predicted transcriptional regulator